MGSDSNKLDFCHHSQKAFARIFWIWAKKMLASLDDHRINLRNANFIDTFFFHLSFIYCVTATVFSTFHVFLIIFWYVFRLKALASQRKNQIHFRSIPFFRRTQSYWEHKQHARINFAMLHTPSAVATVSTYKSGSVRFQIIISPQA